MDIMPYIFLAISILVATIGASFIAYGALEVGTSAKGERPVKAILRCTDCLNDLQIVTRCLMMKGIVIKKTKMGATIYPELTVRADSMEHLMNAVNWTSAKSTYGVTVVKVK